MTNEPQVLLSFSTFFSTSSTHATWGIHPFGKLTLHCLRQLTSNFGLLLHTHAVILLEDLLQKLSNENVAKHARCSHLCTHWMDQCSCVEFQKITQGPVNMKSYTLSATLYNSDSENTILSFHVNFQYLQSYIKIFRFWELRTWGRMVSLPLRSCSPMSEILWPSITIWPPADSINRNRATVREDLPAPVLPTIPIC